MNQIYILIKHENKIETDNVQIINISKDKDKLLNEFGEIYNELIGKYELLEKVDGHASFTNINKEFLIELIIEKRILE